MLQMDSTPGFMLTILETRPTGAQKPIQDLVRGDCQPRVVFQEFVHLLSFVAAIGLLNVGRALYFSG
jgi:hypothetical protein